MKSVSVRLEQELLDKLHIIAAYDGRSVNKEIVMLVKKHIRAYEESHGEIRRAPEGLLTTR